MRFRRILAAAGLGFLVAGLSACSRGPSRDQLSVILVTLDTARADRIGAYGGHAVPTPNLDSIARDGALFEEAIAQVPLTLPSHASILTGRYPASHGVRHNGLYRLPPGTPTLASHLKANGFETAAFVGAYVLNRGFGLEQGFDTYDDIATNRFQGGQDQLFKAERTADDVNAAIIRWLERPKAGRYFLWAHYYDPHDPYSPPEKPGRTLAGSGYDREISYVDACFGDLLAKLRAAGALDRALLVVAGDHGESLGEHGEDTHGVFLYEGAVRVPFLVRLPGTVRAGTRVAGPVELVDIVPTVLDLLGLPPLEKTEGRALRPRIEGKDDGASARAYAETLLPRLEYGLSSLAMVRDGTHKYIRAPKPELYDLRSDPGESANRIAGDGDRAAEMASLLAEWTERTRPGAAADTRKALSREDEQRLRSLGYLGGRLELTHLDSDRGLADPKDRIGEIRKVRASRNRLEARDWAGAVALADEILRENPGSPMGRMTRILSLIEMKRYPEAERDALAALAAARSDVEGSAALAGEARTALASVYRLVGKNVEAEAIYQRVLADDPGNDMAAVDYASLLMDTDRSPEALRLIGGILSRDPRNGMALAARFEIEAGSGDMAAALRSAEGLADARAGDGATLINAGLLLLEAREPARAAACFEVALAQLAKPDPELLGQLGAARLAAGLVAEARAAFEAMGRLAPRDPRPHLYLGEIALRQGDEARGRAALALASELAPGDASPLVVLARWLSARGSSSEAKATLEQALRRDPSDAQARALLDALERGGPSSGAPR